MNAVILKFNTFIRSTVSIFLLLIILPGCSGDNFDRTIETDSFLYQQMIINNAALPVPGNGRLITTSNITQTGVDLFWTAGTDDDTLPVDLQYMVYKSTSGNINTVADTKNNGTPLNAWTNNLELLSVVGLTGGTVYYFNVIIMDSSGNKSIYNTVSVTTDAAAAAPVEGNGGFIATSNVTENGVDLIWIAGTDDSTLLWYLLYMV